MRHLRGAVGPVGPVGPVGGAGGDADGRRPALTPRLIGLDALAACCYALVFLSPGPGGQPYRGWLLAGVVCTVVVPLPLRRLRPEPVFAVVLSGNVVGLCTGVARDPLLAAAFALYTVSYTVSLRHPPRPGRRLEPPVAALAALLLVAVATGGAGLPSAVLRMVLLSGLALGAAWVLGRTVADRRAQSARAVEESARRAATEERLALARELHDVVSGTLNVIFVHASVAGHLSGKDPEQAVRALELIESASQEGIREMRQMLDVLRGEDTGAGSLRGRLERAVETARSAGVDVTLDLDEEGSGLGGLDPEVEQAVHRVVQEGLTNVVRHAGRTSCRVRVGSGVVAGGGRVEVEIVDQGRRPDGTGGPQAPSGPRSAGRGLAGMRERLSALDGTLVAEPVPGGGFRVLATLPARMGRSAR